jgi:1-aminocyclopropane-1-carboxylate deaminase
LIPDLIYTQNISAKWLRDNEVSLDVLRLDEMHPIVSGNKWFKLKYYLQQAIDEGKNTVATFGGAYSNHIIATAYACKEAGLKSIGFIRGEPAEKLSSTLYQAEKSGMQLIYVSREKYTQKQQIIDEYSKENWYIINEGGYGILGAKGAAEILDYVAENDYTHILASVGTATMLAGLVMGAEQHQQIIGISSMKGNTSLEQAVKDLLSQTKTYPSYSILHNYHFGGYAKHPKALIAFITETWRQFQLPLDIVYTSKLFFAIIDLVNKNYFLPGSKLLMIHSGGLQGNNSLPQNPLALS